jgi:hypothetical protein
MAEVERLEVEDLVVAPVPGAAVQVRPESGNAALDDQRIKTGEHGHRRSNLRTE